VSSRTTELAPSTNDVVDALDTVKVLISVNAPLGIPVAVTALMLLLLYLTNAI
jgi:hypothetical protein